MLTGSAPLSTHGHCRPHPSKANRKDPIPHDTVLYRQRHRIENMFGKLKNLRRIHIRYDRCAPTFMSAICIAAIAILWLNL
jgi:transposase